MNYETISVQPVAGAIGAEIHGIDLARDIDNQIIAEIAQAESVRPSDGVDTPSRRHCNVPRWCLSKASKKEKASMSEVSIIGVDIAKRVF